LLAKFGNSSCLRWQRSCASVWCVAPLEINAGTCWEQEYNSPNGLSVEKAPKSNLYLYVLHVHIILKQLV